MRQLYLLLALVLMSSGVYALFKGKDVGAVLIGASVSMTAIQQVEEHKQRERFDDQRQKNRLYELQGQVNELKVENRIIRMEITEKDKRVSEFKKENNILRERVEEKNTEISFLRIEKATLETKLEYTDDPYYMRAKLDNPALTVSILEEFDNPQSQTDESEYNEIEVDSEDTKNA